MPLQQCTFIRGDKMSEVLPFTLESFYKFVGQDKLMTAKCTMCKTLLFPPKPMCTNCFSSNLEWVELEKTGKLVTYTVIHIAPKQFESIAPYAMGILKLEDGPKLLGMIRGIDPQKVKVGMELVVDFDKISSSHWPTWPRYFFRRP